MLLSQLGKILEAIQKYHDGDIQLWELAHELEMPLDRLELLLAWNNMLGFRNRPESWITAQDIVNLITLYYVMRPTHEFKFTVYGNPLEGYASGGDQRIALQPIRDSHPTRQGGRKPPG